MARLEKSIVINAPVEKVFAYVREPASEPEWMPGMVEVGDVVQTKEGVGSHYRFTYSLAGLLFRGESRTIEYVPNRRIVTQSKGGIESLWTWTFEPHGGGTKLSVVVEYTVPIPVLGKLAEAVVHRQNEREADLAMTNIKTRLEA